MKAEKRFTDDDLIAFIEGLRAPRQQPATAIYERAVGRSQVFDHVSAVPADDARVPAGNFRVRVEGIQIDVRKYPVIRVPASDVRFFRRKVKFRAGARTTLDGQSCMAFFSIVVILLLRLIVVV